MIIAILQFKSNTILKFKGTGVVVNKKGLFITAGHLFPNNIEECDEYIAAIPSQESTSEIYKFRKLYHEHFDPLDEDTEDEKRMRSPKYEDLFIGRLVHYKNQKHFKLLNKRPKKDQRLIVKGYFRKEGVEEFSIVDRKADLKDLIYREQDSPIIIREYGVVSHERKDHYNAEYGRFDAIETIKKYSNCMYLKLGIGPGSSGAPIFDLEKENRVVGINLRGLAKYHWQHILCAKYIRRQFRNINKY